MVGLVVPVVVRWSDMDAFGHVNNVQVLRLLEEARITAFAALADAVADAGDAAGGEPDGGGPRRTLLETGVVVARHEVEYVRPLLWRPAPVPVHVWVTGAGGASFDLGYAVGGGGELRAGHGDGARGDAGQDATGRGDAGHGDTAPAGEDVTTWAASTMVVLDAGSGAPRRLTAGERSVLEGWRGDPVPFRRGRRTA